MVTDKLRKYVLPNILYVFIGWAFLKLGTVAQMGYSELGLELMIPQKILSVD